MVFVCTWEICWIRQMKKLFSMYYGHWHFYWNSQKRNKNFREILRAKIQYQLYRYPILRKNLHPWTDRAKRRAKKTYPQSHSDTKTANPLLMNRESTGLQWYVVCTHHGLIGLSRRTIKHRSYDLWKSFIIFSVWQSGSVLSKRGLLFAIANATGSQPGQ